MKTKAAILIAQNEPLEIEELEIPTLGVGQVLVEVHASGICGAQLGEISGAKGADRYLPHLLGHEGGGIVKELGQGVTTAKIGDAVVMHWRKGAGIDAAPPKYKRGEVEIGAGPVATWAEYAVVSENRITVIDKDIPFELAALLGCGVTTGFGLINNEAQLKMGQSILVMGVGGVGLNVVQGAKMVKADLIVAIDRNLSALGYAVSLGADYIFQIGTEGTEVFAYEGSQFDVVVDCTGSPKMINYGLRATASGGKLVLVGQPAAGVDVTFFDFRQHYCGKTIMDSQGGLTNPTIDIPRYINLWKQGKLELEKLIGKTYTIAEVNQAIADHPTNVGRSVIKFR